MEAKTVCTKTKFADEKACDFYIDKLKSTSTREVIPFRSYLCQYCFCWHLTSKPLFKNASQMEILQVENKNLKLTIKEKNILITQLNERIHKLKMKR